MSTVIAESDLAVASGASSPYVGLTFYTEDDADVFFGRDPETEIVAGNLRSSRLTVLYAQSGAGKSSMLRAGVAAGLRRLALRNQADHRSPRQVPVVFASWRDDPIADLLVEIEHAVRPFIPADTHFELPTSSLEDAVEAAAAAVDATLLIVLDQFEELLLYGSLNSSEDRLAEELARCFNRRGLRANFLVSIREDAYAGLGDLLRGRVTNVYGNTLHLEHLAREAAREAIEKPLARHNSTHPEEPPVEIEPQLTDTVLSEVRTGQVLLERSAQGLAGGEGRDGTGDWIETPYLQLVMSRLWEQERSMGSRTLRLATLRELGGSQTIVRTHLSRALGRLDAEQRAAATEVFLHLVTPSGAKIANSVSDLATWSGSTPAQVESLIDKLSGSDERILRPLPPAPGSDSPRVEIFHDVLASAILDWCQGQTERRLRRQRNAARRRVVLVGALALIALGFAIFAVAQRQHAIHEAHLALSNELVAHSASLMSSDFPVASLLSLKAYQLDPTDEARAAINEALQTPFSGTLSDGHFVQSVSFSPSGKLLATSDKSGYIRLWDPATRTAVGKPLSDAGATVFSVAFQRGGGLLASGDDAGRVALWPVGGGKPLILARLHAPVRSVAFSPDGHTLAAGDDAGRVVLWALPSGARLGELRNGAPVDAVAFNRTGSLIASGDRSGNVALWTVATRTRAGAPFPDGSPVAAVAFSPRNELLASGDGQGSIRFWSVAKHVADGPSVGATSPVTSLAFGPRGETLAAGDEGHGVTLWSVAARAPAAPRLEDGSEVSAVAFSPHGGTIASATAAGDVMLWGLAPPARVHELLSDGSEVSSVAMSPKEDTVASGDHAGRVMLWNVAAGTGVTLDAASRTPVSSVAFSPSGSTLASGNAAGEVVLWDLAHHRRSTGFATPTASAVTAVAFSPNGELVAAADKGGEVILWRVADHERVVLATEPDDPATSVAFSPDGATLASAQQAGDIKLWNVASHSREGVLDDGSVVNSVAFSRDGATLASGDVAGKVTLWDVASHAPIGRPLALGSAVLSVAFSPVGDVLAGGEEATTSEGGNVVLANGATGGRIGRLPGDGGNSINSVAFSHDGSLLAIGDSGGKVVLYMPRYALGSAGELRSLLCGELRGNLTRDQWSQYVSGEPYEKLCPAYP